MASKDYKAKEKPRPRHARRGGSGFFWFVTGAVVGAFGVGLAWTLHDRTPPPAASGSHTQAKPAVEPPSFTFHRLLPKMEVPVPDEEPDASAPSRPPKPRKTTKAEKPTGSAGDKVSYLLQIASLRKASDAERLKAKLALLGVRAKIQRVTVNDEDYYRVRAGPYRGRQEVNKTRALLSSNGLDSIAVKLK